jgi:fructose PTS system EIIBC or EIIC component
MKITKLLTVDTILLSMNSTKKIDAIDELVNILNTAGKITNKEDFKKAILKREAQSTTGIGDGIAIPHAKTAVVKEPAIVFGKSNTGIEYEALDGKPSHLFFMIAAPEGANNTHLEALARLSGLLMKEEVRDKLLNATSKLEIIKIIDSYDKRDEDEEEVITTGKKKIVAVTACPTGIAHTYMAADSLKAKASELGVEIKVETNGSGGAKNILTKDDIEEAVAVIVAADTRVEMNRFKGKHVIQVAVADGIRRPVELIEKAINQDAPIFQGEENKEEESDHSQKKGNCQFLQAFDEWCIQYASFCRWWRYPYCHFFHVRI